MNTSRVRDALENLRRMGGSRLVGDVVKSFSSHGPQRAAEARAALAAGNADGVSRAAHALKSSAAQLGAEALAAACAEAEASTAGGSLSESGEVVSRVEHELEEFLRELPRLAAQPGAEGRIRRVGIVEDNDDTRLILHRILEPYYEVAGCTTGPEALEEFTRRPPDAVLLDISLPGMDGTEVLARLRATAGMARVPVIALTAHAMVGDREAFLAQGFDDYASKPILDESLILDMLRRLTGPTR